MGDASSAGSPTTVSAGGTGKPTPVPVLHTQLTLTSASSPSLNNARLSFWPGRRDVSVLFGWVDAGVLVDQPQAPWDGVSSSLSAVQPAHFPSGNSIPVLLADSLGNGQQALGTVASDGSLSLNWPSTTPLPLTPGLQAPIEVYYNLLPVSCGKTVANEILGSGDATQAGQSFKLSKSPGADVSRESGVGLCQHDNHHRERPTVERSSVVLWAVRQRASLHHQRRTPDQNTWVDFGDGINGARLTTWIKQCCGHLPHRWRRGVATGREVDGDCAELSGIAVGGEPGSCGRWKRPRSCRLAEAVCTALSACVWPRGLVFDFEALAAQASGVTMASATWSWDAVNLRASVTVYVAGQPNVAASVQTLLAAAGDPNAR